MKIIISFVIFALSLGVTAETKMYFVHTDHLGTPQKLTDEAQQVVWAVEIQTPFGKVEINEDPDGDGDFVTFNLRFPGQYFDEETGTNYNWFRTYDPALGRYLHSDPFGLYDGPNTYAYVHNNPLIYADPKGLYLISPSDQQFLQDVRNNYSGPRGDISLVATLFWTSIGVDLNTGDIQNTLTSAMGVAIQFEACEPPPPEPDHCPSPDSSGPFSGDGADATTVGFLKFATYTWNKDGTRCIAIGAGPGIPFGWDEDLN